MELFWICVGLFVLLIGYMFYESYQISVNRIKLHFDDLPDEFNGFTILHLSDLHTTQYGRLEKRVGEVISKVNFDICTITGDLTANSSYVNCIRMMLRSIHQNIPIFVVTGNSEYKPWADTAQIKKEFIGQGFNVLSNSSDVIKRKQSKIRFVGVEDVYTGHHSIDEAFYGVGDDEFVVGLTHCPSIAEEMIVRGAQLVLAGHTHGGQVRLPWIGVVWSHMKRNSHLNDGLYKAVEISEKSAKQAKQAKLFVNRGIGTSRLPIRLNCRPQIAIIELHY